MPRTSLRSHLAFAALAVAAVMGIALATAHAQTQATADEDARIWSGVYTDVQATRGKTIYEAYCTRCHGLNLLGGRQGGVGGPPLKDGNFWVSWERAPLSALFGKTQRTMPADSPASLREDDYTDVVAYILSENKFPAGKTDLPATGLESIRIARRAGETTVIPDFALVQVVGCLTRGANQTWALTEATAPLLTRTEMPDAAALAAAAKSSPGTAQLRLVGAGHFKPEASLGQRVEVRGLLSKAAEVNSIDALSLKSVGAACSR